MTIEEAIKIFREIVDRYGFVWVPPLLISARLEVWHFIFYVQYPEEWSTALCSELTKDMSQHLEKAAALLEEKRRSIAA